MICLAQCPYYSWNLNLLAFSLKYESWQKSDVPEGDGNQIICELIRYVVSERHMVQLVAIHGFIPSQDDPSS